jgi:hypothetical protein
VATVGEVAAEPGTVLVLDLHKKNHHREDGGNIVERILVSWLRKKKHDLILLEDLPNSYPSFCSFMNSTKDLGSAAPLA